MGKPRKYAYETERKPFPSRLRQLMAETGTTQEELAEAVGVQRQTISKYASGQNTPDIEKFEKIADFFGVSFDYLLGRSDAKHRENQSVVEETGLSEEVVNRLKNWHEKRTETDKNGVLAEVLEHTKAPRELSLIIESKHIGELVSQIRALRYMAGEEGLVLLGELDEKTVENLKDKMGPSTAREYIMFRATNTFQKMLDDIAPYAQMEEVRPATQADIDKLLS